MLAGQFGFDGPELLGLRFHLPCYCLIRCEPCHCICCDGYCYYDNYDLLHDNLLLPVFGQASVLLRCCNHCPSMKDLGLSATKKAGRQFQMEWKDLPAS